MAYTIEKALPAGRKAVDPETEKYCISDLLDMFLSVCFEDEDRHSLNNEEAWSMMSVKPLQIACGTSCVLVLGCAVQFSKGKNGYKIKDHEHCCLSMCANAEASKPT